MLEIFIANSCKKDLRIAKKQNRDFSKFEKVVTLLQKGQPLSQKYKDHQLTGNYKNFLECHIENDWLLMYRIENYQLQLTRVGTHSELFV
ncbi:MAG: type II toxin-antitoxin system YafQ family toxin [Planctomycetes bacterium]|nr:type II toxin-antitoxin system YafQ family toxin [Planctomycetota bacterium]